MRRWTMNTIVQNTRFTTTTTSNSTSTTTAITTTTTTATTTTTTTSNNNNNNNKGFYLKAPFETLKVIDDKRINVQDKKHTNTKTNSI